MNKEEYKTLLAIRKDDYTCLLNNDIQCKVCPFNDSIDNNCELLVTLNNNKVKLVDAMIAEYESNDANS